MERTYSLLSAVRSDPVKLVMEMSKAIRKHLEAMVRIVVVQIVVVRIVVVRIVVVRVFRRCVDIVPFLLIIAILWWGLL